MSCPPANGELVLAVGNDQQFAALCDVLGVPELADDPRFAPTQTVSATAGSCVGDWKHGWRRHPLASGRRR